VIGVTLVVAGDSFYITLFVVIVFHQAFEGLALGARIALLPDTGNPFFPTKFFMALAFALVTPVGMAIGLGVLKTFNGNDANTLVAMGTLDALSAGILLWVGIVDMWARDWVLPIESLATSGFVKTLTGAGALIGGMVLMGVLGKWA
jgi:solute carrier family 39 (zinc transporter), member 1/2/3